MPTISPLTPQPAGTVSITASTASTVTASTSTDMPLAPGGIPERFTIDANTSKICYMAAIASAAFLLRD
jgi:hypothetical protein